MSETVLQNGIGRGRDCGQRSSVSGCQLRHFGQGRVGLEAAGQEALEGGRALLNRIGSGHHRIAADARDPRHIGQCGHHSCVACRVRWDVEAEVAA